MSLIKRRLTPIFAIVGIFISVACNIDSPPGDTLITGYSHKLVYFKKSGKVILVNGGPESGPESRSAERTIDLWELKENKWVKIAAQNAPPLRNGFAVAYDTDKENIFLYGGGQHEKVYDDFWKWDGKTWTKLNSPIGTRIYALMSFNKATGKLLLFGGDRNEGDILSETWEFDGTNWSQKNTPGPEPRLPGQLEYDDNTKKIILYGGLNFTPNGRRDYDDVWEWNGNAWQKVYDGKGPLTALIHPGMVFDPLEKKLMIFGGSKITETGSNPYTNEIRFWNGTKWESGIKSTSVLPSIRSGTSLIFDHVNNRMVLHGGFNVIGGKPMNDTWIYTNKAWKCIYSCE